MVAAFSVVLFKRSPPAIDREAEIINELSEVGALMQFRKYPDNAEVELNQRSCERLNVVVGFEFGASKIPADTLLNGGMCLGKDRSIHQFEE